MPLRFAIVLLPAPGLLCGKLQHDLALRAGNRHRPLYSILVDITIDPIMLERNVGAFPPHRPCTFVPFPQERYSELLVDKARAILLGLRVVSDQEVCDSRLAETSSSSEITNLPSRDHLRV